VKRKEKLNYCGGGLTHWEEGYFQTLHQMKVCLITVKYNLITIKQYNIIRRRVVDSLEGFQS
jgi:hypothetical protein